MIARFFGMIGIGALMLVTSFGVYTYLGAHQSKIAAPPKKPTHTGSTGHPFVLPGTLYLSQAGALYDLTFGQFTQMTNEAGWMQPSLIPGGGGLLAVKRELNYSDVYAIDLKGSAALLTNNIKPNNSFDIGDNHWSFNPRLSPDGKTLFMSYDEPKYAYEVDQSIWSMPYPSQGQSCVTSRSCRLWTNHSNYTGGDVQPLPLASGALIYTSYDYGTDQKLTATLVLTPRAGAQGTAITDPDADCSQAALSPDGTQLAMICSFKKQESNIFIAPFNGSSIGPLKQVTSNQLAAQPIWAPDGSGIAYLAPAVPDGPFQLWWLGKDAYTPPPPPSPSPIESPSPSPSTGGRHSPSPSPRPSPSPAPVKPIQVTIDLGFDATSPIAWSI